MQIKSRAFNVLSAIAACVLLTIGAAPQTAAQDADPTGTWTWSVPGRNGGEARQTTLKLKREGEKLTGTVAMMGRPGGQARETEIKDGKIKGDEISFTVTREFGGNSFTQKYTGKVSGDSIKGKIEMPGRDGGEARSRDWEAKREKK